MSFHAKYVAILDVETTASEHKAYGGVGRIVSAGIVLLRTPSLEWVSSKSTLVNCGREALAEADPEAMAIHGLQHVPILEARPPLAAFGFLFSDLDWRKTVFASWGDFDKEMFRGEYGLLGQRAPFRYKNLDVRSACGAYTMRDASTPYWRYLSGHEFYSKHELADDRRCRHGLEAVLAQGNAHEALYDAAVAAACLRYVVWS